MQAPNITAINKDIEEGLNAIIYDRNKRKTNERVLSSPLLTYNLNKIPDEKLVYKPFNYPFPLFRFNIKSPGGISISGIFKGLTDGGAINIFIVDVKNCDEEVGRDYEKVMMAFDVKHPEKIGLWLKAKGAYSFLSNFSVSDKFASGIVENVFSYFRAFIDDYMAPSNHIVAVRPDKQGKSVEWIRSREHYTIIHRTHAANNKTVKSGSVVENNEEKHLTRLAHSRRAHYRILKHPKFKRDPNGIEKRIMVKNTWVGPKEWRDNSGQIYKIVERSEVK